MCTASSSRCRACRRSLQQELTRQRRVFSSSTGGRCLADLIEQELAAGERIVAQTEHFVAFCPYASRFPLRGLDRAAPASAAI